MPSSTQRTVDIVPSDATLGKSGSTRLKTSFPDSPIHSGEIDPAERKKAYMDLSLSAVVNDEGHTFGTLNTDYVNSPDLNTEVDIGALNLPSPYVPNPTSPGPGSQNAADKPPAPEGFAKKSEAYGTGDGSGLTPKASSMNIAKMTLGSYIMGKSGAPST